MRRVLFVHKNKTGVGKNSEISIFTYPCLLKKGKVLTYGDGVFGALSSSS